MAINDIRPNRIGTESIFDRHVTLISRRVRQGHINGDGERRPLVIGQRLVYALVLDVQIAGLAEVHDGRSPWGVDDGAGRTSTDGQAPA